jgi:hypothetical protein
LRKELFFSVLLCTGIEGVVESECRIFNLHVEDLHYCKKIKQIKKKTTTSCHETTKFRKNEHPILPIPAGCLEINDSFFKMFGTSNFFRNSSHGGTQYGQVPSENSSPVPTGMQMAEARAIAVQSTGQSTAPVVVTGAVVHIGTNPSQVYSYPQTSYSYQPTIAAQPAGGYMFSSYPQIQQQQYDHTTVSPASAQPLGYGSASGSIPVQASVLGHPGTVYPYSYPPIAAHPQVYGNQPEHLSFPEMMVRRKPRCVIILVVFFVLVVISVGIIVSNSRRSSNDDTKTNSSPTQTHDDHHSTTDDHNNLNQKWLVLRW